jgi:3-polyprenyl-4-hydroxybenzoate decarboxylase
MDDRAAAAALSALERYRDGPPKHPRSYPDLHEHVLALAREGLLVVVDEPINKDTEMHPLVRWQYRGGIPEPERKAFLFAQPTDSKGRRFDIAVLVAGLAANRATRLARLGSRRLPVRCRRARSPTPRVRRW